MPRLLIPGQARALPASCNRQAHASPLFIRHNLISRTTALDLNGRHERPSVFLSEPFGLLPGHRCMICSIICLLLLALPGCQLLAVQACQSDMPNDDAGKGVCAGSQGHEEDCDRNQCGRVLNHHR